MYIYVSELPPLCCNVNNVMFSIFRNCLIQIILYTWYCLEYTLGLFIYHIYTHLHGKVI